MEAKVHEVAELIIERKSQKLVSHGRFIADRFADSSLDTDAVPAMPATPVPQAVPQPVEEREKVRVV
jgi:hypothetical protein